jgi:hypothetical protein
VDSVQLQNVTLDQPLNRETNDMTGAISRVNKHSQSLATYFGLLLVLWLQRTRDDLGPLLMQAI